MSDDLDRKIGNADSDPLLIAGRKCYEQGNYLEAISYLELALDRFPLECSFERANAYFYLSQCHRELKHCRTALKMMDGSIESFDYVLLLWITEQKGNLSELLAGRPDSCKEFFDYGELTAIRELIGLYLQKRHFLFEDCPELLEAEAGEFAHELFQGIALYKSGRFEDAGTSLSTLLKKLPETAKNSKALASDYLSSALANQGKVLEGLQILDDAIGMFDSNERNFTRDYLVYLRNDYLIDGNSSN